MPQPRMDPSLAKRFRSGRACLDFAHTADVQEWVEPELVFDTASLERWLAHVLGLAGIRAQAGDVVKAHQLRQAIWQLAQDRSEGRDFAADDVHTLNAFAAAAPPIPSMTELGTAAPSTATAAAGLSALARDAVDLFTGPWGHRIHVCASPGCALMFVDTSRPGTRRWCSMERCGNLSKVRAHRETKAAGTSSG